MLVQQRRKEQREEQILLSLDDLTYATREQLQIINDLKGDRNAHRILHRMEKDKLISSIRTLRKIYFLSNKGKNLIGSKQGDLKKGLIEHTLMRNELYIKLGLPETWKKEAELIVNDEVVLISDARYKDNNRYVFVEIDNKQSMRTNFDKIKKYGEVFRVIRRQLNYNPQLIWCTWSNNRKEKLQRECENNAVSYKFFIELNNQ